MLYAHDYITDLKIARGDKRIVLLVLSSARTTAASAERLLLRACHRGGRNTSCPVGSNGLRQLCVDLATPENIEAVGGCWNTLRERV